MTTNFDSKRLRLELYGCADVFENYTPKSTVPDLQGWFSTDPYFKELLDEVCPRSILELGTWKGASAIHMAEVAPKAHVVCVDTWLGALEFMKPPGDPERELCRHHGWPLVYYSFADNVVLSGLRDRITPIAQTTTLACKWLAERGFRFDVVYVDASHETEDVLRDIESAKAVLGPGGVVFGDDVTWKTVRAALEQVPHTVHGTKWRLGAPAPVDTKERGTRFAWVPESPSFQAYYAAKDPCGRGKTGEILELGTTNIHDALQFDTKEACEDWIRAHPDPVWVATQHGFC